VTTVKKLRGDIRISVDEMAMFVRWCIANLISGKPDKDKPGKPRLYFAGNFKTSVEGRCQLLF
jgi:hypothetical protein